MENFHFFEINGKNNILYKKIKTDSSLRIMPALLLKKPRSRSRRSNVRYDPNDIVNATIRDGKNGNKIK